MGEWSKSIGEKGEKLCKFLFEDILNFNSLIENESLTCNRGIQHKKADTKSPRESHGIDGLVSYASPLEDGALEIGIISSKYKEKEYDKHPNTTFKSHLKDLAQTIECFSNSKLKNDINKNFSRVNKTELIGILVWISNTSDLEFDLVSKVSNIQIDDKLIFDKIILIDNNKFNFLYQSIHVTKQRYGAENIDFVYHDTGLNKENLVENSYGSLFPLHYLYSDIILLRVKVGHNIELHIFINDDFDQEEFVQILHFAKTFDHLNAVEKTQLHYKNYDSLYFEKLVKEKLVMFPNFKLQNNLELKKFPSDFRNS